MARQQTPSSKDNDPGCPVWRVRKVVVLFCFGKGPLDHEIVMYVDGGAFLTTKSRNPLSHCDLVNLIS